MLSGGNRIATLGLLLIVGLASLSASAQDIERYMLSDAEFRALPPEAQEHYLAGVDALDHIDYLEGHNEFRRAAELAPDSAALQFKLVDLARRQAQLSTSRRYEDYLLVAREALNRVVASPVSSPGDQRRAEYLVEEINQVLSTASAIEQERAESSRTFVHALTLQQDWFDARSSGLKRAILTWEGAGPAVIRSSVVLVDANGYLYRPDMTPVMRVGRHLNSNSLEGATLNETPSEEFMQGVPEAVESAINFDDYDEFFEPMDEGSGESMDSPDETESPGNTF